MEMLGRKVKPAKTEREKGSVWIVSQDQSFCVFKPYPNFLFQNKKKRSHFAYNV